MWNWFRRKAVCPVDSDAREWIDFRWEWLESEFGKDYLQSATVILPRAKYFPDRYDGSVKAVRMMLDRVCEYMWIDPETVELSFYDESDPNVLVEERDGSAGYYHSEGDKFCIGLEVNGLDDPLALVATMSHELGHVHLLGHGRIDQDEEDHELLTDLLTVYMGMGLFTANSVIRERHGNSRQSSGWSLSRLGYLDMTHFGYAFARFARARGEHQPAWSKELRLDVRTAFQQAMRFLDEEQCGSGDVATEEK